MVEFFFWGLVIKSVASLDDTFTKVPILLGATQTRKGKLAFCIGNLIALGVVILIAAQVSQWLHQTAWFRPTITIVILLLAYAIWCDFLGKKELRLRKKVLDKTSISSERFFELMGIGLVISFLTLIDDALVFIPLFGEGLEKALWASAGIYVSTILQLALVLKSAEWLEKLPFKKELSVGGLILFAGLVWFGIV